MALSKSIVVQIKRPSIAMTGDAWTAIFEKYVTDEGVFKAHVWLLGLAVFSTFAVQRGIVWENSGARSLHEIAGKFVVWGVVAEAVCTIILFAFDEGISSTQKARIDRQQLQILEATDRATDAELDLTLYLLPRFLEDSQKTRLVEIAKAHPSLSFQTVTVFENESWGFVMEIAAVLKDAGWNWVPCDEGHALKPRPPDTRPASCATILTGIEIDGPAALKPVMDDLKVALFNPDMIGMDRVDSEIDNTDKTLIIMVGAKR
jgi:hypothetical protein